MKQLISLLCGAGMLATGSIAAVQHVHAHEVQARVMDAPALLLDVEAPAAATTSAPAAVEKKKVAAVVEPNPEQAHSLYPTQLRIASIGLHDNVIPVGVNTKGEMDVPSGATQSVGWYKSGTMPGDVGSAVMDAHVFAAFANLKKVRVGDIIDVPMSDGTIHHFRVYETHTYALADVPAERLFNAADGAYLNLITCAGSLTPDHTTYDHRLVVYAVLDNGS